MGDPGVPMMAGLLAVPVGVLLFVAALVLMGGRWTVPQPYTEAEPPRDPEPSAHLPAEGPAWPEDPWRDFVFPPRPRLALPSANALYGSAALDPYGRAAEPTPPQGFPYGPYRHQ